MHVWKCAARGSLKIQDAKYRHFGTIGQICRAVSSQLRHVSTIGKNLLNIDTSSTCPHNMVNFGLLTAEICWRVWRTSANFNGFLVLAASLHGTLVVGVSQNFAALNRGRHLYLAERPSRWTLAHILVSAVFPSYGPRFYQLYYLKYYHMVHFHNRLLHRKIIT